MRWALKQLCSCLKHVPHNSGALSLMENPLYGMVACRAAKVILKSYDDLRARRRGSAPAAASAVASSLEAMRSKWRTVQHMHHKQLEVTADLKGKGKAVANGPAGSAQAGQVVEQSDTNTCPICLDECAARTVTSCGHYFCR